MTPEQRGNLDGFIAFVAGKPAIQSYPRLHTRTCALGQFGVVTSRASDLPPGVYEATIIEEPATFGALHQRLLVLASRLEGTGHE